MHFDPVGGLGVAAVERAVRNLGCAFRRQPEDDVGIDAQLEIVVDGIVTGRLIALQIKSGESYFREANDVRVVFRSDHRHAEYWLNFALPVVIALHDPRSDVVYWQQVTPDTLVSTGQGVRIDVPKDHQLASTTLDQLIAIAAPPRYADLPSRGESTQPPPLSQVVIAFSPGTVTFRGDNLGNITRVETTAGYAEILQASDTVLEARLPLDFNGTVRLYAGECLVQEHRCDMRPSSGTYSGIHEVIAADLPLYSNAEGSAFHPAVLGLLVRTFQAGESYEQLWPARPGRYSRGQFLGMLHHDMTAVVGDSWYRDPTTQELRLGFNGAATLVPEVLPSTSLPKLSAIFSLPENPTLYPSEIITLSARGVESLGDARREIDLSAEALWESSDPSVASVENRILRAQAPGDVQLRCTARAFQRVQAVAVLPDQPLGERTYFAGLRRTSQIAFDVTDNLYVCNQSRFVHRILRHGGFERILELPDTGFHHNRIDCIAVNHTGDVFVSNLEPTRRIAYFRLNRGGFDPPVLIGPDDGSVKKSIAFTSDGSVVVGIMGNTIDLGEVLQILPDSSCTSFKTRGSAHNLAVGPNNMVYAVSSIKNAVDVYDRSGRLLESIQFPQPSSVGAIAVGADGKIYVALWHPGRIITYNREPTGYAISTIALSADTPSGIAIDSTDALYFSDFQTGRIEYLVRRS